MLLVWVNYSNDLRITFYLWSLQSMDGTNKPNTRCFQHIKVYRQDRGLRGYADTKCQRVLAVADISGYLLALQ
jgi:hypothetical protein